MDVPDVSGSTRASAEETELRFARAKIIGRPGGVHLGIEGPLERVIVVSRQYVTERQRHHAPVQFGRLHFRKGAPDLLHELLRASFLPIDKAIPQLLEKEGERFLAAATVRAWISTTR